jgi:putative transposase
MDEFDDYDEDAVHISFYLHVIFSTKKQAPLLTEEMQAEIWEVMRETLSAKETTVHGIGGAADHVHGLISPSVNVSPDELIQAMKKESVAWMRENHPGIENFAWQEGYAGFAISAEDVPQAVAYIQRQAEHHEAISFQDEYRALLMENGIEFDEKDLFD